MLTDREWRPELLDGDEAERRVQRAEKELHAYDAATEKMRRRLERLEEQYRKWLAKKASELDRETRRLRTGAPITSRTYRLNQPLTEPEQLHQQRAEIDARTPAGEELHLAVRRARADLCDRELRRRYPRKGG